MTWYELLIGVIGSGGIGALIATVANVIQARRKSVSEEHGSKIEQTKETVGLVDELLQKQLKWMSDRMDSGDAVRQQEFKALEDKIDSRFEEIKAEDAKQNGLLSDIVEFLNGEFQEFEQSKKNKKGKKP